MAWATEAQERGIISEKETQDIKFRWGDYSSYIQAVHFIFEQPNQFYQALARGVEHAAQQYGGERFCLAFGGNEMPGYHTVRLLTLVFWLGQGIVIWIMADTV